MVGTTHSKEIIIAKNRNGPTNIGHSENKNWPSWTEEGVLLVRRNEYSIPFLIWRGCGLSHSNFPT